MTADEAAPPVEWRPPRHGRWPTFYRCAIAIWAAASRWYGLRVHGRDRLPATGPVLLVVKHNADVDPPFVNVAAWPRPVVSLAKEEHFRSRFLGMILSGLGTAPIRMGSADVRALRFASRQLALGRVLVIYPEGRPSFSGDLLEFNNGAGLLALAPGVVVVPVAIWGAHRLARPGGLPLRRGPVHVSFCEPLEVPADGGRRERAAAVVAAARAAIQGEMSRLMSLDPDPA